MSRQPLPSSVEKSISYLASKEALESIDRDPYWPKWDSPWWHMCLLNELGLASEIPQIVIAKMVNSLKTHYLPVFPVLESEIPVGADPRLRIACFCAIGNMYQVLFNAGVDVDQELPWMYQWIFKYQLPDGGLNCDEKAYLKSVSKSSILSTIACLEAILFCRKGPLKNEEVNFLNQGATYLLSHKLYRKISTGEVIDPNWLEIRFPRYYDYDFLRGFYFLEKWRQKSGFSIPDDLVAEVENLVLQQSADGIIRIKRYDLLEKTSYNPLSTGQWQVGEIVDFPLMREVGQAGSLCPTLTLKWNEVKPKRV